MKRNNLYLIIALAIVGAMGMTSCARMIFGTSELEVPLVVYHQSVPTTYKDLDKAVKLVIKSDVNSSEAMYDDSNLPAATRKLIPRYTFTPSVRSFAEEATTAYMQQMRFDMSPSADYTLYVDVKKFKMQWIDKKNGECVVQLLYRLTNEAGENVVPSSTASATIRLANAENFGAGLGRAYAEALRKINWDRIADCLRVAKTAKQEKNAQVNGAGDTALEHTVIRWFIQSSPQGADVSWRVVSSTPDVSNTNSNFVGTTPYESTEAFDIRGLTYNNSGNVQIEVTCERSGYLTQRKRFNLRQAIDQKEISAKFNLIKED